MTTRVLSHLRVAQKAALTSLYGANYIYTTNVTLVTLGDREPNFYSSVFIFFALSINGGYIRPLVMMTCCLSLQLQFINMESVTWTLTDFKF